MFPKLHASVCQQNGLGAGALDGAFTDKTLLFQEFQHMDHAGMPDIEMHGNIRKRDFCAGFLCKIHQDIKLCAGQPVFLVFLVKTG